MKIISGSLKGRYIKVVKTGLRPTRAVVRSAIFNILGERIKNAYILDIFAGTGAMGIEGLSRGAGFCVFIEKNPAALLKNISALNLLEKTQVIKQDFRPGLKKLKNSEFDIVFIDPPYRVDYLYATLRLLYFYKLLHSDSFVIAEYGRFSSVSIPEEYETIKERRYGNTVISFLRLKRGKE